MSFFETTTGSSTTSGNSSEACENCSSNFTIFKRKKTCHICRQLFCQSCVNRHQISLSNSSNTTSNERICVICQSICSPQTTLDDIMKCKLKHLKCILNASNVAMNTCKEKRDIAELVLRTKSRIGLRNNSNSSNTSNNTRTNRIPTPPPTSNTNQPQQNPATNTFNDTFSNFMHNVHDFVNFNLNSVSNLGNTNAQPMPAPGNVQQPQQNNNSRSSSSSSSNSQQQQNRNSTNSNNINGNTFSHSTSSDSHSGSSTNGAGLFNLLTEQVPNIFNHTFTNNNVTINNLFNGENENSTNTNEPSANTPNQNTTNTTTTIPENEQTNTNTTTTNQSSTNNSTSGAAPVRRRASLSQLNTEDEIDNLTIKQIKEILACNFVDYKGCCEKKELVDKTKRLYSSYVENKRLANEINQASMSDSVDSNEKTDNIKRPNKETVESSSSGNKKSDEDDLCKICMESLIDCVLLDCGHMVSCIKCGKRLAECPMCRQNIVRVIRVFKS